MHHSLKEWLKIYIDSVHEWDEWTEAACFSYNTSVHSGTRVTPFQCIFGKLARVPSDNYKLPDDFEDTYEGLCQRVNSQIERFQDIARINLIKAKQKSKLYYDRRINPCAFAVGESVMLMLEPKKNKFSKEYIGPFKILELLNGGKNIKISYGQRTRIVHPNKLRKTKLRA